jgi:hypothetical protein
MGEFDSGKKSGARKRIEIPGHLNQAGDDKIQVGAIGMVGDGHGGIAQDFNPAKMFSGNKDTVTEKRMGMEINHGSSPDAEGIRPRLKNADQHD